MTANTNANNPSNWNAVIQSLNKKKKEDQERAEEDRATKIMKFHIESISIAFDKVSVYTNIVILGGYGAYWGIWKETKDHIAWAFSAVAMILIILSIAVFICFEVFKMISFISFLDNSREIINSQNSAVERCEKIDQYCDAQRRRNVKNSKLWIVTFVTTASAAFLAVATLMIGLLVSACKN